MTSSTAASGASSDRRALATAWRSRMLTDIIERDELRIARFRDDGTTPGTPTWIWCVEVAGEVCVRAYHGVRSSRYRAARRQHAGLIETGDASIAVSFETVDENQSASIDDASERITPRALTSLT